MRGRMIVRPRQLVCGMLCASAALGCRDLSRFDTSGEEAYCGSLVSSPLFQEGFLPEGVPPRLRLKLTLDTDAMTSRPGELTSDDADQGLCSADGRPLLDHAPLRAIEELSHDPLSLLEFGDGREHNFLGWVDSTCQGTLLSVVSLMSDGNVEVRLLKPAALAPPDAPPEAKPGFALFPLERRPQGCGF
jgi:hypothetical protein